MSSAMAQEVSTFTAWCECPSCHRMDCHYLRTPIEIPDRAALNAMGAELGRNSPTEAQVQAYLAAVDEYHCQNTAARERRIDGESDFAVVRTCTDCGHEWGQS